LKSLWFSHIAAPKNKVATKANAVTEREYIIGNRTDSKTMAVMTRVLSINLPYQVYEG
jgi:hypothetical protein